MKNSVKIVICVSLSICALLFAIGAGSVFVPFSDIFAIIGSKLFGAPLIADANTASIIWNIRLPRALSAFCVGAMLAAAGTVMQSVLQNPLASSYTLGVSSGATLGAALVIVTGFSLPFIGIFTLPIAGFVFGLVTVLLAMAFALKLDHSLKNQTVILVGMVLSLFVNAILTLISGMFKSHLQQLTLWQMGSLSAKNWQHAAILFFVGMASIIALMLFCREMDILTFGDEQASSMGISVKKIKFTLIVICSLLTGTAVCFTGVIGFVDLVSPHIVRRIFNPSHKLLLPLSAIFGGGFLAIADTLARVVLSPVELPVGAITALIGAPFFAFIYFKRRRVDALC